MGTALSHSSSPGQPTILTLPNELLLLIASHLSPRHIHTLLLTNHRLHTLLTPHLFSFAANSVTLPSGETLTALQWAAYKGHTPLLRYLLSHQVDINAHTTHARNRPSTSSSTPLHLAVTRGDKEAVRLLLHAGARSDIGDSFGDTAVHRAVAYASESTLHWLPFKRREDDMGIVRMLLDSDSGLGLGRGNNRGDTPLHLAVLRGALGVAYVLLESGAPVNARNGYKYTPLHVAALSGRVGVVRVLMEWGADVEADGEWCLTPGKLAAARGWWGVVKVLGEVAAP